MDFVCVLTDCSACKFSTFRHVMMTDDKYSVVPSSESIQVTTSDGYSWYSFDSSSGRFVLDILFPVCVSVCPEEHVKLSVLSVKKKLTIFMAGKKFAGLGGVALSITF